MIFENSGFKIFQREEKYIIKDDIDFFNSNIGR